MPDVRSAAFALLAAVVTTGLAACGDDGSNFPDARWRTIDADTSPAAVLPPSLAIGAAGCGVPLTQTFTVANTGGGDLTYTIASSNGAFTVTPSSGTILAGTSTTFTASVTLPATTAAGSTATAMFTVTSNLPGAATATIDVSAVATGGQLEVPASVPFGEVVRGATSEAQTLQIRNTGNAPVSLALGAPTSGAFALSWAGSPAAVTIDAGGELAVSATFAPAGLGVTEGTSALAITGAVCGAAPPASLSLTGTGVRDGTVRVAGGADFGTVDCGPAGSDTRTVRIVNNTDRQVTWAAELVANPDQPNVYTLGASSGALEPDGTADVTVTRAALGTDRPPGDLDADLAIVTTVAGSKPVHHGVGVHTLLRGPFFGTELPSVDYGFVPAGRIRTRTYTLHNRGNAPAIPVLTGLPAGFRSTVPAEIAVDATGEITLTYEPTELAAPVEASVSFGAQGLCGGAAPAFVEGGIGPFASFEGVVIDLQCPVPEPFTQVQVTNLGNRELVIRDCADRGESPVGARFIEEFPRTFGTDGESRTGLLSFEYLANRSGEVRTEITCATNDRFEPEQRWPITRSLHGADLVMSAAPLAFDCDDGARQIAIEIRNQGNQASFVDPVVFGLPYPLELVSQRGVVEPGGAIDETFLSHSGDGNGSGSPCGAGSGSEGEEVYRGTVEVRIFHGKGDRYPVCSVAPEGGLPVTLVE